MSANNYIQIKRKGLVWKLAEHDDDTGDKLFDIGDEYATLEEAISYANEYCANEEVEYGYRITLPRA